LGRGNSRNKEGEEKREACMSLDEGEKNRVERSKGLFEVGGGEGAFADGEVKAARTSAGGKGGGGYRAYKKTPNCGNKRSETFLSTGGE